MSVRNAFSGKVVIISGASSGIGRELAHELAAEDAILVLAARHVDELERVAEECRKIHETKVLVVKSDVREIQACKHLIEATVAEFGRIDILINNAGFGVHEKFEEMSEEDLSHFEDQIKVNYLGSVYCTYFALPYLKKTKGQIVATSSLAGLFTTPYMSGYSASKHAMAGFFNTIRAELYEFGIAVTVLYPSFVATGFNDKAEHVGHDQAHLNHPKGMDVEACVKKMVKAIAQRKRSIKMTAIGKVGGFISFIAPKFFDKVALKVMRG